MRTGRRAMIINAYSARNVGDAAIMLATAELLRDLGWSTIAISSRHHAEDRDFYQSHGAASVPPVSPFPVRGTFPAPIRVVVLLAGLCASLAVAVLWRRSPRLGSRVIRCPGVAGLREVAQVDCVVVAGGGYVYSAQRRLNLSLVHAMASVRIATLMGKRTVMMPQSIGPLRSRWDRAVVRWGLSSVDTIVVREDLSARESRRIFDAGKDIRVCPDVAFYRASGHDSTIRQRSADQSDRCTDVTIVVMDWTWARGPATSQLDHYIERLSTTIDLLTTHGYRIALAGHSFMPEQGQQDLEVARRIMARLPRASRDACTIREDARDIASLESLLTSSDVVIGTRLHSCILSLASGTPAIALAYQPKAEGTYRLLCLQDLCLDVQGFSSDELLQKVEYVACRAPEVRGRIRSSSACAREQITATYSELAEVP